jgi:hypothetical protein
MSEIIVLYNKKAKYRISHVEYQPHTPNARKNNGVSKGALAVPLLNQKL